jgi:RNA polymerase sigma-70 factor (ECF subfamily)
MSKSEKLQLLYQALDEFIDGLYSYAMLLSRNREDAEDIVQETCLRAIRSADAIHADGSLKSWLFVILRNIWLNQLRRRSAAPQFAELDEDVSLAEIAVETGKDPDSLFVRKMEGERIRRAIEQLPADHREIILLREYEELSYREIAAVLGCPIGTVMSRLQRARLKLSLIFLEDAKDRG